MVTSRDLSAFNLWLKRQGVKLESVQIKRSKDGVGVFSTSAIDAQSVLMIIPETAVMSLRNLKSAETESLLASGFPGSAVLQLAIAAERLLGAESQWFAYLQTLPAAEDIPIIWEEPELQWLSGTGLDVEARRRRKRLEQLFEEMSASLAAYPDGGGSGSGSNMLRKVSCDEFVAAASLTSSRCMFVDDYHDHALVPAADAINHKCALAPLRRTSEGEDEESEGEEEAAVEDKDDLEEEEEEEEEEQEEAEDGGEGEETEEPVDSVTPDRTAVNAAAEARGLDLSLDVIFHNLEKRPFEWDSSDEEEDEVVEEEEEAVEEAKDEDGRKRDGGAVSAAVGESGGVVRHAMVISMRALPSGVEVFNTYGELGNRRLLALAGFVLPNNPLDIITLTSKAIKAGAREMMGEKVARAREQALRRAPDWSAVMDANFEFDLTATPSASLRLLLWLLTMPKPLPWVLSGGDAADAAVAAFAARPVEDQMLGSGCELLRCAVRAQMACYRVQSREAAEAAEESNARGAQKKRKLAAGSSTTTTSPLGQTLSASRLARAEALVSGEIAQWEHVLGCWAR